eukprot:3941030-Rhodomonas_salina.2
MLGQIGGKDDTRASIRQPAPRYLPAPPKVTFPQSARALSSDIKYKKALVVPSAAQIVWRCSECEKRGGWRRTGGDLAHGSRRPPAGTQAEMQRQ